MQPPTVMGPASNATKGLSPTDPSVFDPAQDLQEWRRDVARWVDTIATAAEKGSDRLYKTVFATLTNHLYDRGLPSAQKSIVDEAQAKCSINFKQDDQIAGVRDIIELITIDPPIAVVSRLITYFNKVTSCRRRRDEQLSTFVSRFRGLAADHLMHGGLSSSSQVGEILAITLLNIANLSEETLTNAKLQLLSLAQAREKDESTRPDVLVSNRHLNTLVDASQTFSKMRSEKCMRTFPSDTRVSAKAKVRLARQKVDVISSKILQTLQEKCQKKTSIRTSVGAEFLRTAPRCRLNLDDAEVVLRNLSFSPNDSQMYKRHEIENLVGQKVQKALSSFSHSSQSNISLFNRLGSVNSSSTATRNKNKRKRNEGSNNRNLFPRPMVCNDCGSKDHWRGHDECKRPSYRTTELRAEGRFDHMNKNKTEDGQVTSRREHSAEAPDKPLPVRAAHPFHKGSNPLERKHH